MLDDLFAYVVNAETARIGRDQAYRDSVAEFCFGRQDQEFDAAEYALDPYQFCSVEERLELLSPYRQCDYIDSALSASAISSDLSEISSSAHWRTPSPFDSRADLRRFIEDEAVAQSSQLGSHPVC